MARFESDTHFRKFCDELEVVLAGHEEKTAGDDLLVRQRQQLRDLVSLESDFREALIAHSWGVGVYKDFVSYIVKTRRNILAARPFFRERHTTFTAHISKALKKGDDKTLYKYRINWSFVDWVLKSRKWKTGSKPAKIAKEIQKLRSELLEQNLPLALSQARQFWNATPKSHLSYMDVVQIQCQGLLLAIDKFVPPTETKMSDAVSLARYKIFRAVAIGIMRRDRVNAYSETLVHFFPKDGARLYRANKALRYQVGDVDFDALASKVTKELADSGISTTGPEIQSLLAASSTVSADYSLDPEGDTVISQYADESSRPDETYEAKQAEGALRTSLGVLDIRERKLVKLKGVQL